jgi:HlyD family secretion protein
MQAKTKIINAVLAVGALTLGAAAYVSVGSESSASTAVETTVTATRGTVTSTVSASGNVSADTELALSFQQSGRVTEIAVKAGQRVTKGSLLAAVDDSAQVAAYATAEANLQSAEARLANRKAGLTVDERAQAAVSETQAELSVDSAQATLDNATASAAQNTVGYDESIRQATLALANTRSIVEKSTATQQAAVDQAQTSSDAENATLTADQAEYDSLYADQTTCDNGGTPSGSGVTCANVAAKLATAKTALDAQTSKTLSAANALTNARNSQNSGAASNKQSVDNAENTLRNAQNNKTSGELKDQQTVANAARSLTSAQTSLESTVVSNRVKAATPKDSDIASDEASIASAKAALETAKKNLDDTKLKAPIDGTVGSITGILGQYATTGGSSTSTSGFLTLTDLTKLRVKVGFSESDATSIRAGQSAKVTFDALTNASATGQVVSVDTSSTLVSNVVTYYVIVEIDNAPTEVKPGMTASVDITVATKTNVLSIPTSAVTSSGTTAVVTVKNGKTSAPTTIGIGLRGDDGIEITSGLKEGDVIVLASSATPAAGGGLPTGFPGGAGGLTGGLGGGR